MGDVHQADADVGGKDLRRQAAHQRLEIAGIAGVKSELIVERQTQRRSGSAMSTPDRRW